jgi:hypothetical protein
MEIRLCVKARIVAFYKLFGNQECALKPSLDSRPIEEQSKEMKTPSCAKNKKGLDFSKPFIYCWRPQGDSNPCYRRERAMS